MPAKSKTQGKGSHRARRALIENEVDSRRPFEKIYEEVKKGFEEGLEKQQKAVMKATDAVFDLMVKDYDRQFKPTETNDPTILALRTSLQGFVKDAYTKINGPIQLNLARAMGETK